MPYSRLAALVTAFKSSPGELTKFGSAAAVIVALLILGAAVAVFLRVAWGHELNELLISFTALFVVTALVLVGYARRGGAPEKEKEKEDAK